MSSTSGSESQPGSGGSFGCGLTLTACWGPSRTSGYAPSETREQATKPAADGPRRGLDRPPLRALSVARDERLGPGDERLVDGIAARPSLREEAALALDL